MSKLPPVVLSMLLICGAAMSGCTAAAAQQDTAAAASHDAVAYANRVTASAPYYTSGWFEHDGLRLHYVEAGEGPLVLMVHGFPSFWLSFLDQMEALKSRYRVVAVDALGAGASDKPDTLDAYRVDALVAQLHALGEALSGGQRYVLIGHDWGSALSLTFAETHPARLAAVIGMSAPSYNVMLDLLDTNAEQRAISSYMQRIRETPAEAVYERPPGERIWRESYGRLLESGQLSGEEGALFRRALAPAAATNGGFNWYRANIPPTDTPPATVYYPDPPRSIRPPVLFVAGGDDRTFVPEHVDYMRRAADDIHVVILPGVGHWTSMQQPAQSIAVIDAFLARLLWATPQSSGSSLRSDSGASVSTH